MYYDSKPCSVCGSEVRLRARDEDDIAEQDGPVGPREGYVGGGDETVDERICTNPACPSHNADDAAAPSV